jgi:beta-glucosidase-like glycosyl hydrolase
MSKLERLVGAVLMPEFRPAGGASPGAPKRLPSRAYLERFPPLGVIGFGRRLPDGKRIEGLREVTAELVKLANRCSGVHPFVCADLECGAGYHMPGASLLPPARAMAAAESQRPGSVREAAKLTGFEARRAGIDLVLAPVLDVNTNPQNPIIGVRAFGTEVAEVIRHGREFLAGLADAGAGACIKHYPGHGDTRTDSHLELPRIDRDLPALERTELAPFHALLSEFGGSDLLSVMVAHLDVPALTGVPGLPTTLSLKLLQRLRQAGFRGAALTDGLAMKAVSEHPKLGTACLLAGCDGLLAPVDEEAMAEEILGSVASGELPLERLEEAAGRMGLLRDSLLGQDDALSCGGDAKAIALASLSASEDFVVWKERFSATPFLLKVTPGCEPLRDVLGTLGKSESGPILIAASIQPCAGGGAGRLSEESVAAIRSAIAMGEERGRRLGFVWFGADEALSRDEVADLTRKLRALNAPILIAFAPSDVMVDAVASLVKSPV